MITDKNTLKSWFRRGLKPLETQFAAWMDSYWHKSESIPTKSIEGLEDVLNNKAEGADIDNINEELKKHFEDDTRHKTEAEQGKLNNLADNPDSTYATKDELEAFQNNPEVIIIPIDFGKAGVDRTAEIKSFLLKYVEDGSIYTKPIFAHYMWKNTYEEGASSVKEYQKIVPSAPWVRNNTNTSSMVARFNYPVEVIDIDTFANTTYSIEIGVLGTPPKARIDVMFFPYLEDESTVFIYENGDGILGGSADEDKSIGVPLYAGRKIRKFYDSLKRGGTPALYLRTNNTDNYIPASYRLVKDQTLSTVNKAVFLGEIQISYLKNVDGVDQLWIETRKFTAASKGFFGINSRYELPPEGIIQKTPIGGGSVYILNVNGDMSVVNPEIIEEFVTAHIAGKNPRLMLCALKRVFVNINTLMVQGAESVSAGFSISSLSSHVSGGPIDMCTVEEYFISARKIGGTWNCSASPGKLVLNAWDYMKASNIHVVAEYPADLTTYPDGSIFIKTVS